MRSYIKELIYSHETADIRDSRLPRLRQISSNLNNCANYLRFNHYYTVDQVRLVQARTCQHFLLCPFCAARRAAKQLQKQLKKVEHVLQENPSLIPVMITLTVKNGPDLEERFKHLKKSFDTLKDRRRDYLKKGWGRTEFRKVHGSMFSYEFTNSGNGWHPHVHMIALVTDYIDQAALSQEWESITGDSKIVDVRKIRPKKGQENPLVDGMAEVFKYALKFQDMSLEDNYQAFKILSGRRLLGSLGSLFDVDLEPDSTLDEAMAGLPFLELFYSFNRRQSSYTLKTVRHFDEHGNMLNSPPPDIHPGGSMRSIEEGACPLINLLDQPPPKAETLPAA